MTCIFLLMSVPWIAWRMTRRYDEAEALTSLWASLMASTGRCARMNFTLEFDSESCTTIHFEKNVAYYVARNCKVTCLLIACAKRCLLSLDGGLEYA